MAFAESIQLQEFLVYCIWCGEEKALSLDPELHVKYPTTILHTLAARRTSCCGGSTQDRGMGRRRQHYGYFIKSPEKNWKTLANSQKLPEINGLL